MKIKVGMIVLVSLLSIGCRGVNRLLGQEPHDPNFNMNNVNPDDYYVTGETSKINDAVYMSVKGRTITVEVKRPADSDYVTLRGNYVDYVAFTIPNEGVRFWNDSTPAGSLYRIHTVKAS